MVKLVVVAPAMGVPFNDHWYAIWDEPAAATLKEAFWP